MDVGKEEVHLWQPQCHAYRDSDMAHFPSRETPVNSLTRTFGLLPEHITKTQFVPAWNTGRASDGSIVVHGIRKPGRREDGVILRGGRWWGCEGGADWPVMVMTIDGGVRVRALQWHDPFCVCTPTTPARLPHRTFGQRIGSVKSSHVCKCECFDDLSCVRMMAFPASH